MSEITRADIVLVVDDSPDALSLINDALEAAGMDVLVALEGKQALTIAKRIRPDIILLDAIMPNMNGFDTCKALKTDPNLASIPVIFMTGLTETEDIVRGLEAGGVDYLTKPIKPSELLARMKVHLSNARLTESAQSALDSTGQHLLTINAGGTIQWATPQAYALFAKARADDTWQTQEFAPQLKRWLTHSPKLNQQLKLEQLSYPLAVRLVNNQSSNEILLKLVDGERPSGSMILKDQLNLTGRESEVLYWVANGKTSKESGEILSMSPRTVDKHMEQVFTKLGVENRTAAAGVALRLLNKE